MSRGTYEVQIHLVRLKDPIAVITRVRKPEFQFHLVRLKASSTSLVMRPIGISIPFSTIKRDIQQEPAVSFYRFQFHLVRLKEALFFREGGLRVLISIPFSTIKREHRKLCERV